MATSPLRPSTMRTTDELPGGGGHEVDQRDAAVLRLEDRLQDQRAGPVLRGGRATGGSAGAIRQRPLSGVPTSAAKQAALSKRGQHSQSIEPSRLTSAALWQSPISA